MGQARRFDQVASRPAVAHPYGNVFPNTGRKFRPFSGKSFPCAGDDKRVCVSVVNPVEAACETAESYSLAVFK